MKILALTGSIGMGKSTAAAMLRRMRIPVYCADEAVHALLAPGGGAVERVARLYPKALQKTRDDKPYIDRAILGAAAFHDRDLMRQLEAILHSLVRLEEKEFLRCARRKRAKIAVLDIPLLYETRGQARADKVLVVTAPGFIQAQRVLARPGMNAEKLKAIRERQLPDAAKRRRADIVLHTGLGRAFTWRSLRKALGMFI